MEGSGSTWPENAAVSQEPRAVVRARDAGDVQRAIRAAYAEGLVVAVQGTGHGAGRPLGAETLLIDSRGLDTVTVDAEARTATVGAGAAWGAVQAAAEQHGLLGLAGTSPLVGVAGYTFGGGIGWLTRPHGLAADALRSVAFVDGAGELRLASDDAPADVDRRAIRAFRGGQPVGIATSLTFDLVRVPDLVAGYLLWRAADARAVIDAWAAVLKSLPADVTSTMALLHLPPQGPFPDELLGTVVAHLSFATPDGRESATPLLDAVRAAAAPVVDTAGPSDAGRLAGIHLDPPPGRPSRGDGRWLDAGAVDDAFTILDAAGVGSEDGLAMVELRHVASGPARRDGAQVAVPAPFVWQGLGTAADADDLAATVAALDRVRTAAGRHDVGRAFGSFRTGQHTAGDAFDPRESVALRRVAGELDPHGILRFERTAAPRATADLVNERPELRVVGGQFLDAGGVAAFDGPVRTVRSPGDHGLARQLLEGPGDGAVLVVDGGGQLDLALVGDDMLAVAIDNGWAGIVVAGAVRDRALMERRPIGVKALGADPRSSPKNGAGEIDLPVTIGGVVIEPGRHLWADRDGIVVE